MKSKKNGLNPSRHGKAMLLCGVTGIFLMAAPAAQANWEIKPELGAGVGWDDNARLSATSEQAGTESYFGVNAEATVSYNSELTKFKMTPRVTSKRFDTDSELDADDLFLRFNFDKRGVKSNFRFRGDISREAVRTGERLLVDFETENPEDIEADNSGLVIGRGERDRISLAPNFTYNLSRRYSLGLAGNYISNSYDDRSSEFLSGFQQYSLTTSLAYDWTEKDDVYLFVGAGNYETDTQGEDSKSDQIGLGYNRRISKRTSFRMRVGSNSTKRNNGPDNTNAVGQVSIVHRYLRTTAFATYRRSVSGSGDGGQSLVDGFNFNLSRPISPTITLNGGAYGYTSETINSQGDEKRDYVQARVTASWSLRRNITLDFDYRFTHVKRSEGISIDNEDSNEIALWFYWSPNPSVW